MFSCIYILIRNGWEIPMEISENIVREFVSTLLKMIDDGKLEEINIS